VAARAGSRLRPRKPALLLALAFAAFGGKVTDYSVDMVMLQGDCAMESMELYVSGQKSRTEGMMAGGMISIARKDFSVAWTLYPAAKTYLETPLTGGKQPGDPDMASADLDRPKKEILGRENMLGYACTKMRVLPAGERHPDRAEPCRTWAVRTGLSDLGLSCEGVKGKELVRRPRRAGVEVTGRPGGTGHLIARYQGRKAPVPMHGDRDRGPDYVKMLCKELGLDPRRVL
jgi:mRNA interferase HicA